MCTLIAIHRRVLDAPLVVAANRDEFFDRPAEGPAIRSSARASRVLAPRDLRAGGTWLGLNEHGVFAALTNRPTETPDPSRRSRGELVLDALDFSSAEAAARELQRIPEEIHNPFNLFVADARDAFALVYRDRVEEVRELEPGAHVIGNALPNDRTHTKTARILAQVEGVLERSEAQGHGADDLLEGLAGVCCEHGTGEGPTGDTCIHLDGYGTRSSILMRLADHEDAKNKAEEGGFDPTQSTLRYAEGAPCTTPYENFTSLLTELSRTASYVEEETPARKAS